MSHFSQKSFTLSILLLFTSISFATEMPAIQEEGCRNFGKSEQCQYKSGTTTTYMITNMPYALCAQAKCQIDDKSSQMAACQCPIYGLNDNELGWKSISLSSKPYSQVKPVYEGNKLSKVTSNFSLAMSDSISKLNVNHTKCTSSKPSPWANCYGVVCDVKYVNEGGKTKAQANCQCPVSSSLSFMSSGPANTSECQLGKGQIWSAADGESATLEFELISQVYKNYQTYEKTMLKIRVPVRSSLVTGQGSGKI